MLSSTIYNADTMRTNIYASSPLHEEGCDFWVDLPFIPRVDDAIAIKDFVTLSEFEEVDRDLIVGCDFKVLMVEWCRDELGLFQSIALMGIMDPIMTLNVYEIDKIQRAQRLPGNLLPDPEED